MANTEFLSDTDRIHHDIIERASSMKTGDAIALARKHMEAGKDRHLLPGDLVEMGLHARGNLDYRKELESVPELAKRVKDSLTVGDPMEIGDWKQAKELAGGNTGRVYLPKMLADYAGKILMVTDTHVIQQASRNSVVAHDLSRLSDSSEIAQLNRDGNLQGKVIKISYGVSDGRSEILSFTQVRANEIMKEASAYAEQAIKTPQARAVFLKHIEAMNAEKVAQSMAPRTPTRQPQIRQQRDQERSR